ncbi:MAG: type II secretion system minor pseudopilin GspJ [Pseudomonadota bacterium]
MKVQRDSGFSLMETLVALFVVATLSTAGGSLLLGTINSAEQVNGLAEDIRELEVASALMRDDFAAMTTRASRGPSTLDRPRALIGSDGSRDGVVLAFVRGGWSRNGDETLLRSDLIRVEYHRRGNALVRKIYTAPDPGPSTPTSERVVVDSFDSMVVRYFDEDVWYDVWLEPGDTPEADMVDLIEVSFDWRDGTSLTQSFLAGGAGQ